MCESLLHINRYDLDERKTNTHKYDITDIRLFCEPNPKEHASEGLEPVLQLLPDHSLQCLSSLVSRPDIKVGHTENMSRISELQKVG